MKKLSYILFFMAMANTAFGQYYGQFSVNPYNADSISNPYGEYGSPYSDNSINNPYNRYHRESRYAYGDDSLKLYDERGNFRGNLNNNPYDPDSIANPYGRYGSPYSSESINNPYGAGNPYASDSPFNPYGNGWSIRR